MNVIIGYSFTIFIDIAFAHLLLTRKRNVKYTSFLFIINFVIFLFGYVIYKFFIEGTKFSQYMPTILGFIFAIYFILAFKESISKKIFTMFSIRLFSTIILALSGYIMSLFFIEDINIYKYFSIVLRNFIQLMFVPIIYLFFKDRYKKMLEIINNKFTNIITFYSIIIFLFLGNYFEFDPYNSIQSNEFSSNLLLLFIIVLSYIIIFMAISYVNRNIELEYKFKIVGTELELQKQNYKTLNKSIQSYYAFKHDIRHHILAMKSMIDAKNYIAASEYFEEFNENEINENIDVLCKNFTVDSILKYYMSMGINNNIDFKVTANIPEDINIDNLELSVVMGNCVENAIEACNNIFDNSKKYINIKAEIKGFQLVVKIVNSFNGYILEENKVIKTSKSGQGHGIGLSNVRSIVEKYNGFFNVKHNNNEFEVNIVMNIS